MTGPERQPGATGFALRDPYPWADLVGLARAGEEAGYRALFLPEVGARDTLATLTGLAGETDRLLLGTGVVPVPARSPALLAMAAATVQERSGGRLLLGVGTGPAVPGRADEAGLDGRGPPPRVRRRHGHGRRRSRRNRPPARRSTADLDRGSRTEGDTPRRRDRRRRHPQLVHARAGGEAAASEVAEGAEAAGRDPASVTIAVYVRAALAPGTRGGRAASGRRVRDLSGVSPAVRRSGDRPGRPRGRRARGHPDRPGERAGSARRLSGGGRAPARRLPGRARRRARRGGRSRRPSSCSPRPDRGPLPAASPCATIPGSTAISNA